MAEALLTVTVNRNLHAPKFDPQRYTVEIQDNEPMSSSFTQVKASDADVQVAQTHVKLVLISCGCN